MSAHDCESNAEQPSTGAASGVGEAIALGVIGLIVLGGLFWWIAREPGANGDGDERRGATASLPLGFAIEEFIGEDACAECHPSIAVYHERHGHSRTFRRAGDRALAARLDGRVVADPERPAVTWRFLLDDGRLAVDRQAGDRVDRLPIDFALGSGYHATTFISVLNDDPHDFVIREHRLTYYADGSIRITPGQGVIETAPGTDAMGRVLRDEDSFDCVKCHVTLTSASEAGHVDLATLIPTVSCERCHGPGRTHAEAARRGADPTSLAMPFGPGRASAKDQMLLCGECHRHPSQAPPGALRPDNIELARFQPVGLMQSRCFTESDGAMSCTTCHDPHDRPSTDPSSYNTTCLSCHQSSHPTQVSCPVSPSTDCTTCHMPRVDAGQKVFFADHWIRVRDEVLGATGDGSDPPSH
ncbi:multiheme c-type cytochrome [Tautonia sociabilis]|uniref:Cytochrome c-552/4 domain-containing protein n=1 Tax=Tautonia sociabilis TaxID=2080755 RepID=A0A432MP34_9BACT|nr:multiheme c-type cytochrome [Tautonia sociabilis]RUL89019.1 hypothetical protein TsocGM_03930 [Tautonia sociabilis]